MHRLFLGQWISGAALKAVCWTLVHSLWIGLLAAIAAAIVIACTRRSTARLRYNLLGAILLLFVGASAISFGQQWRKHQAVSVVSPERVIMGSPVSFTVTDSEKISSVTLADQFVAYLDTHADFIVRVWAVFFLLQFMRLFTGLGGIQRLRRDKTHSAGKEWSSKVNELATMLGITRAVHLLQSELVNIPVVVGYFKPVILVPIGLLSHLPPEQVETILLHELAHIRRRDFLINILQRLAEAVFFFNPALLWISSLIRQEREACCDDIVVTHTRNKSCYLEALVSFQEYSYASQGYAMGISSKKHYLLNRVRRILTRENKKLNLMEKILLMAGLLVIAAFRLVPAGDNTLVKPGKEAISGQTAMHGSPVVQATTTKPIRKARTHAVQAPKTQKAVAGQFVVTIDTIPSPTKTKPAEVLEFTNVESNTNSDGGNKHETVTVTEKSGRKTSFVRRNGKLESLTIDGKAISQEELDHYQGMVDNIDRALQERREARARQRETDNLRRAEAAKQRSENLQLRQEARRRQAAEIKERQVRSGEPAEARGKAGHETKLRVAEHRRLREQATAERTRVRQEQMRRQKEARESRRSMQPTRINGREVIKLDDKVQDVKVIDDSRPAGEVAVSKPVHSQTEFGNRVVEVREGHKIAPTDSERYSAKSFNTTPDVKTVNVGNHALKTPALKTDSRVMVNKTAIEPGPSRLVIFPSKAGKRYVVKWGNDTKEEVVPAEQEAALPQKRTRAQEL